MKLKTIERGNFFFIEKYFCECPFVCTYGCVLINFLQGEKYEFHPSADLVFSPI